MWENELREWAGENAAQIDVEASSRGAVYRGWKHRGSLALRVIKTLPAGISFVCRHLIGKPQRENREEGFTLVELLVVLAILGLLIGLVAPRVMGQLGSAKHKIAQQSIERLAGILDLYHLDVGDYPSTAQGLAALDENPGGVAGWNGPYLKDAAGINDSWGHPFQYRYPSQRPKHSFDIISLGADGKVGGEGEDADIINR
jgi:general secretion pathway protein G